MKAWILNKPGGTLELKDVATPEPERGSAVVAVQAVPLLSYLRAYVEARRTQHLADRKTEVADGDFATWHQWALDQAARIDPLCPNPPSILDKATPDIMNAFEP